MNEAKQSLPIDLFTAPSASGIGLKSSSRALAGSSEQGPSFSKELTRASERSTAPSKRSSHDRREVSDSPANEKPRHTEASHADRSKPRESSRANAKDDRRTEPNDVNTAKGTADKEGESDTASTQTKPSKPNETSTASAASSKKAPDGQNTNETAAPLELVDAATNVLESDGASGEELPQPGVASVDSLAEDNPADESLVIDASDPTDDTSTINPASMDDALVAADNPSAPGTDSNTATEDAIAVPRELPAEAKPIKSASDSPVTPVQLANRSLTGLESTQLTGSHTAQTAATEGLAAPTKPDSPALVASALTAHPVLRRMDAGNSKTVQAGGAIGVNQLAGDDSLTGESQLIDASASDAKLKKEALEQQMQASRDAQATLSARKADQQLGPINLIEARQLMQQQAQNLSLASAVSVPASADVLSQSPDNMFLSTAGGIVTAPVLQRADTASNPIINAPLNLPLLQNDADKAMAGNIRWMSNEGVKNAVVNVTPQGMGPISVTVGIEKEQINVSIVAMQGSTREALDSMLPRLREQLASQGHTSVNVDISDGRPEQSERGYAESFMSEQGGSGQGAFAQSDDQEPSLVSEPVPSGLNANTGAQQGVSMLLGNGQIASSYDLYV